MFAVAAPLSPSLCEIDLLLPIRERMPLDNYVNVEFRRRVCRPRWFAMGGFPYFKSTHRMDAPSTRAMVPDIIAGRLVPQVLELFDGIQLPGAPSVPCFVTNRRQPITTKFNVTLTEKLSCDPTFNVTCSRSISIEALDECPPSVLFTKFPSFTASRHGIGRLGMCHSVSALF
jgi:hypothetical protein